MQLKNVISFQLNSYNVSIGELLGNHGLFGLYFGSNYEGEFTSFKQAFERALALTIPEFQKVYS